MSSLYDALKCVAEEYAAAQTGADLLAGRVTGTDPLCVELSPGLTVSQEEGFLSVARHLTQYDLDVDLRLSGAAHGGKITVDNRLKVGEQVLVLRAEGGQHYVALDRIGGP